jgi:hypothetical protein
MAIAKTNALGNPNQPLKNIGKHCFILPFQMMPSTRKLTVFKRMKATSFHILEGQISANWPAIPTEQYLFLNSRDIEAAKFLGIKIQYSKKSRAGDKFLAFNNAIRLSNPFLG